MVRGYQMALDASEGGPPREPEAIRLVTKRALGRNWKRLARERIHDPTPVIPLGRRFWPLADKERQEIEQLVRAPATREHMLDGRKITPDAIGLLDAAYWMKGCSSLGKLRYAAVARVVGADRRAFFLIDVKEAVAPAAPSAAGANMPNDDAERVRAGAMALSPHLGSRIATGRIRDVPVFLRELKPQDLKIEVRQFTRSEAVTAAKYLAFVVGRAHARQMPLDERRAWMREFDGNRSAGLDAPHWLWSSVVELAARHEFGYLEHCRIFGLARRAA
jgi:uncharacterized protein (DUF2252 family)